MNQQRSRWQWPLILLNAVFWILSLYFIVLCYIPGPFRDDWEVLPLLEAFFSGQPWKEQLWESWGAGAHRPVMTRLLFLLDYQLLEGNNLVQTSASVLLQISTLCLILFTAHRSGLRGAAWWLLSLNSSLLLFSAAQFYNLTYAFDNQWFVSTAAACAAIWSLCRYAEQLAPAHLLAMLGFAVLASLGNGSGLSVWPALLVLALLLKLPRHTQSLLLAVLPVIAWLWWPRELLQSSQATLQAIELPPWYILLPTAVLGLGRFFLVLLGNTWSVASVWVGGLLGLAGLIYLVLRLRTLRWHKNLTASFFLGIALFAALAAATMTLGRGMTFSEATTSRFFTIPLLFWCGLFADALWQCWQHSARPLPRMVTLTLLTVCLAAPAYQQELLRNTNVSERVRHGLLAQGFGLRDWQSINITLSWYMPVNQRNPAQDHEVFFLTHQVGHHALPLARFRHQTLTWPESRCRATNTHLHATNTNGEYTATLHNPEPGTWLIVDVQQRVIGALRPYRPRGWWWPLDWLPVEQRQWRGFAKPLDSAPAWLLRLEDQQPVCHLPAPPLS